MLDIIPARPVATPSAEPRFVQAQLSTCEHCAGQILALAPECWFHLINGLTSCDPWALRARAERLALDEGVLQ